MTSGIPAARKALGRGATAEALVHLWNELEPARLSGDRGRLEALARLAEEVRQRGDEAEAEAEAEPAEGRSRAGGLANWLWLVFVLVIVLANILGQLRD